ncbi:THUMP domain-containing protein 3, partial [Durusdinium trenchii]
MVAIGSGVGSIMPWKADMTCYDIEVLSLIHHSHITVGLSCAQLGAARQGATHPSKLPSERRPWHTTDARHLRFSTARLMLRFARLTPGARLLDFCGGSGTIALEAACEFRDLHVVSADDKSGKACRLAEANLAVARAEHLLAEGSQVKIVRKSIEEWRRHRFESSSHAFDLVISELPFGVSLRRVDSSLLIQALNAVLHPEGCAALICPQEQAAELQNALTEQHWKVHQCEGNILAAFHNGKMRSALPLWDESMRTYQWVEHKIRSLARKPSDKDIDATAQQERRGCLKRGVDGNWKPFE